MNKLKSILIIIALTYPSPSMASSYYNLYEDMTGQPAPTFRETICDIAGFPYYAATYVASTGFRFYEIIRRVEFYWHDEN